MQLWRGYFSSPGLSSLVSKWIYALVGLKPHKSGEETLYSYSTLPFTVYETLKYLPNIAKLMFPYF